MLFSVIILTLVLIILNVFFLYVLFLKNPREINCSNNSYLWNSNCIGFQENFLDDSLKSPSIPLKLISFDNVQGAGNPIYLPMWYRYRYINMRTGGYSPLSDWTNTPIIAGSCCLPCLNNNCTFSVGFDTCNANSPKIGIFQKDLDYIPFSLNKNGDPIGINIHRYVDPNPNRTNPPSPQEEGTIIGYLIPGGIVQNQNVFVWNDVLANPCSKGCEVTNNCMSGVDCDEVDCSKK